MTHLGLPGFSSPAAGFDAPLAMLAACHDRVRRSLGLLGRLAERVREGRVDAAVHDAARDVLRYFDLAAPQHHEDEERHIFPALLASPDEPGGPDGASLHASVRTLQAQHLQMRALWLELREPLAALAGGADASAFDDRAQALAQAFAALYDGHAAVEEALVFPRAQAMLDAPALAAMGAEMAQRRGARGPT